MEETVSATTNGGYNKRPLWQWIVIYVILGAVIYGAVYYFFLNKGNGYNSKSSMKDTSPSPSSSAMMGKQAAFLLKPVNDSDEAGAAILKEENGQTKVTINLTGFTKDIEQPVHIHIGACPGVGSVKYPLTSVVNGISTTTLSVTLDQLKKELPLAINVHKSATEVSTYTACGHVDIK